jgi:hypothetical protein
MIDSQTGALKDAPAPDRRPHPPLGGPGEFEYRGSAPLASPAAVGEAQRWLLHAGIEKFDTAPLNINYRCHQSHW